MEEVRITCNELKKAAERAYYDGLLTSSEAKTIINHAAMLYSEKLKRDMKDLRDNGKMILRIEPGRRPKRIFVKDLELDTLQEQVGGYIECVYYFDDPIVIICNEEGKIQGMRPNRALKDEKNSVVDVIAGTFVIVGLNAYNEFSGLSEELADKFEQKFYDPESFVRLGEKLIAIADPGAHEELDELFKGGEQ